MSLGYTGTLVTVVGETSADLRLQHHAGRRRGRIRPSPHPVRWWRALDGGVLQFGHRSVDKPATDVQRRVVPVQQFTELTVGTVTTAPIYFDSTNPANTAAAIKTALVNAGFAGANVLVDAATTATDFIFDVSFFNPQPPIGIALNMAVTSSPTVVAVPTSTATTALQFATTDPYTQQADPDYSNPQYDPSVAMGPEGQFVIVWSNLGQDLSWFNNVSMERYDENGNGLAFVGSVGNSGPTNYDFFPDVAMGDDGMVVVTYTETADAAVLNGMARRIRSSSAGTTAPVGAALGLLRRGWRRRKLHLHGRARQLCRLVGRRRGDRPPRFQRRGPNLGRRVPVGELSKPQPGESQWQPDCALDGHSIGPAAATAAREPPGPDTDTAATASIPCWFPLQHAPTPPRPCRRGTRRRRSLGRWATPAAAYRRTPTATSPPLQRERAGHDRGQHLHSQHFLRAVFQPGSAEVDVHRRRARCRLWAGRGVFRDRSDHLRHDRRVHCPAHSKPIGHFAGGPRLRLCERDVHSRGDGHGDAVGHDLDLHGDVRRRARRAGDRLRGCFERGRFHQFGHDAVRHTQQLTFTATGATLTNGLFTLTTALGATTGPIVFDADPTNGPTITAEDIQAALPGATVTVDPTSTATAFVFDVTYATAQPVLKLGTVANVLPSTAYAATVVTAWNNADLLAYFNPFQGDAVGSTSTFANMFTSIYQAASGDNDNVQSAIDQVLYAAQYTPTAGIASANQDQLGRLQSVLQTVAGALSGESAGILLTQFDANSEDSQNATFSDSVVSTQRLRPGPGVLSRRPRGRAGRQLPDSVYVRHTPQSLHHGRDQHALHGPQLRRAGRSIPRQTALNIANAINALLGTVWPAAGVPLSGSVNVHVVPQSEINQRNGSEYAVPDAVILAETPSPNVVLPPGTIRSPTEVPGGATSTSYVFQLTFQGQAHDTWLPNFAVINSNTTQWVYLPTVGTNGVTTFAPTRARESGADIRG